MILPWDDYRFWLTVLGIILSANNYYYYISRTLKGEVKPHLFSWGIWAALCLIAFAAQWSEDAGPGMWQTAFWALGLSFITILAFLKGDRNYTRSDWLCLAFSLLAIPLWVFTKTPLWSVLLITLIDCVASIPTFRKAWAKPHEESSRTFAMAGVICALSLVSLEVFNVITSFYVFTITLLNFLLAFMILYRRKRIHLNL